MTETATMVSLPVANDDAQPSPDLALRVSQLESEKNALEQELKTLRTLLERTIDHRQKSHNELVLIITGLVSKLPLNDVGGIVARLVEHNNNVGQYLAALIKGTAEVVTFQPAVLKTLEQTKRDLATALKPAIDDLLKAETPIECDLLQSLVSKPELFFSPRVVRANRCFVKGYVPRERILKEFGEPALVFFTDVTTDPKRNPNPKPEEIALGFRSDFEAFFQQNPNVVPEKRQELMALYQKVQRSKAGTDEARSQKNAFLRTSLLLELLHYYENQNTEAPDAIFAQRLPGLIEQLVLPGSQDKLEEPLIANAESLLAYVITPEHRQMVVNNLGKAGGTAKTLKYVMRLRAEKVLASDPDNIICDFVKHLVPGPKAPPPETLATVLRLIPADMQLLVIIGIMDSDRLRKPDAEALGKAVAACLELKLPEKLKAEPVVPPEIERAQAWEKIKDAIGRRLDAPTVAAMIRDRLNAKYDADEIRQSWLTLIEADTMSLIRAFCQIPYLPSGKTDPIARTVIETYVSRLTHEKYAATYQKIVNSLRNMYQAKPDAPTLVSFLALVRWVDHAAADKLSADIGIPVAAQA